MWYYTQAFGRSAYAPVAQLDRVTDYESVGRGFESLLAYQLGYMPHGGMYPNLFLRQKGLERPARRKPGNKQSGGLFVKPWESPQTIRHHTRLRITRNIL